MKNILFIGSGSFIAKGVASYITEQGYTCCLTSRNNAEGRLVLDMEDEKSIIRFSELNKDKKFDGIFFFQGVNPSKNTKETSFEHINRLLAVNLAGPTLLLKYFHQNLNPGSLVLFMSSIAASKGSYDPAYASAKAGLIGLMSSLANEFREIRFNCLSLGLVENSPVYEGMTEDFRRKHADNMFNGEFVKIENISTIVLELLKNTSINRSTIPVNGGYKL